MEDFTFRWPFAAFFLVGLLPLVVLHLTYNRYRRRQLTYFSSEALETLLTPRSAQMTTLKFSLWIGGCILSIMALMQPEGHLHYLNLTPNKNQTQHFTTNPVLFLVDTSASMAVADGPG